MDKRALFTEARHTNYVTTPVIGRSVLDDSAVVCNAHNDWLIGPKWYRLFADNTVDVRSAFMNTIVTPARSIAVLQ